MIAMRFHGDPFVPSERFETLKATFGDKVETIELDPKDAQPFGGMAPHSVLTLHLKDDDPGRPHQEGGGAGDPILQGAHGGVEASQRPRDRRRDAPFPISYPRRRPSSPPSPGAPPSRAMRRRTTSTPS